MAEEYYKNLFTFGHPTQLEDVLNSVDKVVINDIRDSLLQTYTAKEVRTTLFQMHPSKAPSPDGMSQFFFQKFWSIVGPDVTSAMLSVLHSGKNLRKMNFTHILLIPKKNEPQHITKYRPISLANVISRLVLKVLANWLKNILPKIISDAQSAFVLDRLITDYTMVAFEMLHHMRNRRQGKIGHMAVKLDISKAYDRVERCFLERIMIKLGLPEQWVDLAMNTVRIATYSILLNGEPRGYITPTRGIRQGDPPLSIPFFLYVEGLSSLLRQVIASNKLHAITSC